MNRRHCYARATMHVVSPVRNDGRILREATALRDAGLAVTLVDIETSGSCPVEEEIQGMRARHIMMKGDFGETRFTKHAAWRALTIFLRSTLRLISIPTDIYHAHDTIALPASALAALVRRKPLVFDAHELPLAELRVRQPWLRKLMVLLLSLMIRRCAGVITVSEPIAGEITRTFHARQVTLVRNTPIYQKVEKNARLREYLRLGPEKRIALYQGNIQEDRHLERVVRAVRYLGPDIVLVLMGRDMRQTVASLQELARREGVSERVCFVPAVPPSELLEWTASADLGLIIYAAEHSLNVKYCLPNKLFEYMMAGLPVLATNLDAVAEVLRTYGVGRSIASNEEEEVGRAISELLMEREGLARMQRNAISAAQGALNWEKEQQHLLALYAGLTGSPQMIEEKISGPLARPL